MEEFKLLDESYLNEMAKLYQSAFINEPWNDNWSDEEQLNLYIKDLACNSNSLNYGLLIDGKLEAVSIGMIKHWWQGTNYNIEELCVNPNLQGKGIGSRFLDMIENDIKKRGLAGIYLQTDLDKPSYKFYKKNGFEELDKHVSFYKKV
jgi:aminoglycoside 6'-N-acetyltransferase I